MKTKIENGLKRVNNYLSTIKHPQTLKYCKGYDKYERTLIGIVIERLQSNLNNEMQTGVKLSNLELAAFEQPIEENTNGYYFCVDMSIHNDHICLIPISKF